MALLNPVLYVVKLGSNGITSSSLSHFLLAFKSKHLPAEAYSGVKTLKEKYEEKDELKH